VRERSRDPEVERERERDATDADDAELERERERLLLGGVRESDRDRDRLGDRLDFLFLREERGVLMLLRGGSGAVRLPIETPLPEEMDEATVPPSDEAKHSCRSPRSSA